MPNHASNGSLLEEAEATELKETEPNEKSANNLSVAIKYREAEIVALEDTKWRLLTEVVRQGTELNKHRYSGKPYAAEIAPVIDNDYLTVLESILAIVKAAPMNGTDPLDENIT